MTPSCPLHQPANRPLDDREYRNLGAYQYEWEAEGARWRLLVPDGFVYDLASVPRIFWSLLGIRPDGLHRAAALVHDWIYAHQGRLPNGSYSRWNGRAWEDAELVWTRRNADRLFARLLREGRVKRWRRRLMFKAVHWFGGRAWASRDEVRILPPEDHRDPGGPLPFATETTAAGVAVMRTGLASKGPLEASAES